MESKRHGLLCRLWRCQRGAAAIEFALLLPVLVMMLVGGITLEDAVIVSRKVTAAARTLANVTTQYTTMAESDVSLVLSASKLVLEPYSTTPAGMVVSELSVTSAGTGTVVWSRASGTATARATGSTVTVPTDSSTASTSYLIYAEVSYAYVPSLASAFMSKNLTLSEKLFMVPRRSTSIPLTSSSGS
ncbi:pilus assembly protein [Acetobacter estunensis]|nr:pilus assembly protein [Acetobacter estunensis]